MDRPQAKVSFLNIVVGGENSIALKKKSMELTEEGLPSASIYGSAM
jgi:hypothetical protein